MPENVIISYRGANYAIGQGQLYYGIWPAVSPQGPPIEWWQHTPEGWSAAWSRFSSLEVPGTIAPVNDPGRARPASARLARPPRCLVLALASPPPRVPLAHRRRESGCLRSGFRDRRRCRRAGHRGSQRPDRRLVAGDRCCPGIVGLFPNYIGGASLASATADFVPHAIYLAAWTCRGADLGGRLPPSGRRVDRARHQRRDLRPVPRRRGDADHGRQPSLGAGLVLSILGWLACTAGSSRRSGPGCRSGRRSRCAAAQPRARPHQSAGTGPAAAAAPVLLARDRADDDAGAGSGWCRDRIRSLLGRFTLQTSIGGAQTITEGNTFSNPGAVIFGDVVVMLGVRRGDPRGRVLAADPARRRPRCRGRSSRWLPRRSRRSSRCGPRPRQASSVSPRRRPRRWA